MTEDDTAKKRLSEIGERVKEARSKQEIPRQAAPPSQLGIAFRLVSDLLAAVLVGGGLGWAFDWFFGTSPILLIVMFLVGVATGIRNLMRTAREMNESQRRSGGL